MKPLARTDRLIKQVVGQDTLVYDKGDDSALCLSSLASAVWRRCDGQHTVEEIAAEVAREITLPEGVDPEAAVWRALEELDEYKLLRETPDGTVKAAFASTRRRELLKAMVMVPLFPQIGRIAAPHNSNVGSQEVSATASGSAAVAASASATVGVSASTSGSASASSSASQSPSVTNSASASVSVSASVSESASPSVSLSRSASASASESRSASPSVTQSRSTTPSVTQTRSATSSVTTSRSASVSPTPSNSF
jgi:hypothetical protein